MQQTRKFELNSAVAEPTLEGEHMPEVLAEINGVIDSKYNRNKRLKVLELRTPEDGLPILVGSSPLIRPVIDIVLPNYRAIRPEELEQTLREGDTLHIQGNHYVDYGIVWDFSGNNHELAVEVFNTLPGEFRELDRLPAVMLDYGLRNSTKGDYGVAPTYREGTELRTAEILKERTGDFDANDEELVCSGLPAQLGVGRRRLYTAQQGGPSKEGLGISGFGLDWDLDIYASYGDLACLFVDGWIVSVPREATRPKK